MLDLDLGALERAGRERYAIGAFQTYNLETTLAVCRAAEALRSPVLLQAGSSAFRVAGRSELIGLALAAAEAADAPVGVHLDHCRDLEEIRLCLDAGYTSVMIDGSGLPFEENVSLTRAATQAAHAAGVWIEGELGGIAGDEDVSTGAPAGAAMTDPKAAAEFVSRTGVDVLAVAIGNVHGFTPEPVRLDFTRLAAIGDEAGVPLVLHGASGLPAADISHAISLGVVKINVNAELRRGIFAELETAAPECAKGYDLASLSRRSAEAGQRVVEAKLREFGSAGRAGGPAHDDHPRRTHA